MCNYFGSTEDLSACIHFSFVPLLVQLRFVIKWNIFCCLKKVLSSELSLSLFGINSKWQNVCNLSTKSVKSNFKILSLRVILTPFQIYFLFCFSLIRPMHLWGVNIYYFLSCLPPASFLPSLRTVAQTHSERKTLRVIDSTFPDTVKYGIGRRWLSVMFQADNTPIYYSNV